MTSECEPGEKLKTTRSVYPYTTGQARIRRDRRVKSYPFFFRTFLASGPHTVQDKIVVRSIGRSFGQARLVPIVRGAYLRGSSRRPPWNLGIIRIFRGIVHAKS